MLFVIVILFYNDERVMGKLGNVVPCTFICQSFHYLNHKSLSRSHLLSSILSCHIEHQTTFIRSMSVESNLVFLRQFEPTFEHFEKNANENDNKKSQLA